MSLPTLEKRSASLSAAYATRKELMAQHHPTLASQPVNSINVKEVPLSFIDLLVKTQHTALRYYVTLDQIATIKLDQARQELEQARQELEQARRENETLRRQSPASSSSSLSTAGLASSDKPLEAMWQAMKRLTDTTERRKTRAQTETDCAVHALMSLVSDESSTPAATPPPPPSTPPPPPSTSTSSSEQCAGKKRRLILRELDELNRVNSVLKY